MRHTAIALTIAVLGVSGAFAADLPPASAPVSDYRPVATPFTWTGCYIGANGGWHRGQDQLTTTSSAANFVAGGDVFLDGLTPVTYNPSGGTAGGQVGCNGQLGYFVASLEGDANWVTGTESRTLVVGANAFIAPGDFLFDQTKATFLATARARLGVAVDRVLFYVTGGAAFGTLRTVDTLGTFGGALISPVNSSISRAGWTVGGGVEWAFLGNLIVKAEYLYVDLGTFDVPIPCQFLCTTANDTVVHHKYTDNVFRLGLNYLLNYNSFVSARY
jgi:outer membrane immunogenic protein